ncbi:glycerophosphodiester phosphodiesterase family protein [Staphylococcus lutrae]|uniref:Glycerophosphoryl diester phosphodiesterase n=1 Tax=Staphylococcus lutrae TaxID=155085 RepID=A0AAC9RU91_9STAP|nr:glycerophosphodiester phosphodiesterase family protein [Staphylococcus lutrae]ARJ52039.1 glycerophosphoryl diester phosphodiesterase [Staphylococcus lutrae]PNZ34423.1 glycerophosphoryl diester phosphodiesterase [Staphylococcus lutrae]
MTTIFAHRGLPSQAPENTLASFDLARKIEGVKWIEFDLAITEDEVLIVIHDDDLERTTNTYGEVSQTRYAVIQEASAGAWYHPKYENERILTFEELVVFANRFQMNLNIELKGVTGPNGSLLSERMLQLLQKQIKQLNPDIEVLISSFNFALLKLAEQYLPQYKRAVLFERCAFYNDWRTIVDYCGSSIVHLEDIDITRELVTEIKTSGYTLNMWTVNDKDRANMLINWGVDGLFTDNADQLTHFQHESRKQREKGAPKCKD